jgi:hypothetical protein
MSSSDAAPLTPPQTPSKSFTTPTPIRLLRKKTPTPTPLPRSPQLFKKSVFNRPNLLQVYKNQNIRHAKETNVSEFVEFMKENFGEDTFSKLIWNLSTPVTLGGRYPHVLTQYPSWLTDIMQEFIELLQNTPELPELPDIFLPLQKEILKIYVPTGLHDLPIAEEDFIKKSNEIVDNFINVNQLDPNAEIATNIKIFYSRIVFILFEFIKKNGESVDVETRVKIRLKINELIPILKRLIQLNNQIKKKIIGLNMEDVVRYGKFERESDIKILKEQDPKRYTDEWYIARGLDELYEERQEARDERRRQREYAGQGGRKKNIRSSRKKRNSKKRTYKKRSSYKNKKNVNVK